MAFIDKELTCRDCSNGFIFTAGEQEFYANKGLQNEPVRCPPCRTSRKNNRLNEPEEGYVRYGVFASFGGRTPRQMHPATCADCGIMTEVPFQPRGDRPVYCSACYTKIKGAAEGQGAPKAEAAAESANGATDASSDDEVKAEAEGESAPAAEADADGAADASSEEEVKAEEADADGAADASSEEEVKAEEADAPPTAAEVEAEADEAASEDEEKPEPVAEEAQASS